MDYKLTCGYCKEIISIQSNKTNNFNKASEATIKGIKQHLAEKHDSLIIHN